MRYVIALVLLAACKGETPPDIDANPLGRRCGMTVYDLCFEEHDCATDGTKLCQNFAAEGFQVCTQACSGSLPCPDDSYGVAAVCENNVCKPSAANMCHLP